MTETATTYERVTVPRFKQMLEVTGITLAHGTYFEDMDQRTEESKKFENCYACAVGTVAAYCSMKDPEDLNGTHYFTVEGIRVLVPTLPVNYLAGLEQGYEDFGEVDGDGVAYDGIASEYEVVNDKWKPKIDTESEDYKLGKIDGYAIREAQEDGKL